MSRIDDLIRELCPEGVEILPMGDIGMFIRGQRFVKEDIRGDGESCIHYGEVYTKYAMEANRSYSFLDVDLAAKLRKANPGDVIIAAAGETVEDIGKPVVWMGSQPVVIHDALYAYSSDLSPKFVAHFLRTDDFRRQARTRISSSKISAISIDNFKKIRIPVPPLEVQREIVSILDKFTQLEAELEAELEARRVQYEETRNNLLNFDQDLSSHPLSELIRELCPEGVKKSSIGEAVRIRNGKDHKHLGHGDVPVYGSGGVMRYADAGMASGPSVLIPRKGSLGNLFYVEGQFWVVDTIFYTEVDESKILARFLFHKLKTMRLGEMNQAGGVPSQTQSALNRIEIEVPPLEIQREIVSILDKLDALVNDISYGLPAEIEARRKQYEYYRNKLLTFKELDAA